jgi:diguanylate cyclase (GGDEF)-like protein
MSETAVAAGTQDRTQFAKLVGLAMWTVLCLHAVILLAMRPAPIWASRSLTAAVPVLASIACVWRATRLPARERPVWLWSSAGMLLWAFAHVFETVFGQSRSASVLAVDAADFIYLAGTFPLLIAFSTTRETQSLRTVFALNLGQIALALILSYALLYRMSLSPAAASTVMGRIYGSTCVLLAVMAILRTLTWGSQEERKSLRCICLVLWTYLPIELAMDYASARWNLQGGTLLDLLWSAPFLIGGWQALHLPLTEVEAPRAAPARSRLVVEALCPMLITAGIFVLAASVTAQHRTLGLSAIFVLLAIQAVQATVMQLNYLAGRKQLLEHKHELEETNAALRQMSLEDPLTQIANRRHFETTLQLAWRRCSRKGQPIALLMIDIDFFKGVNDHHGHSYGDECLVSLAQILRGHARRPDDIVARLGGEEFVMLLPDTEMAGAKAVAARMHQAIHALGVANHASPFNARLTVSIGVGAVSRPSYGVDPSVLVDCADQALYDAKHQGRNRTSTRRLD